MRGFSFFEKRLDIVDHMLYYKSINTKVYFWLEVMQESVVILGRVPYRVLYIPEFANTA